MNNYKKLITENYQKILNNVPVLITVDLFRFLIKKRSITNNILDDIGTCPDLQFYSTRLSPACFWPYNLNDEELSIFNFKRVLILSRVYNSRTT